MGAPTIVATAADPNANSYVTVAQATAYAATSLHEEDWTDASEDLRAKALIAATRAIESQPLRGSRFDVTTPQRLHYPTVESAWQRAHEETFTAALDTAVQLSRTRLQADSALVYDAEGTEYTADEDYEVDAEAGTITALSGGALSDGEDYLIDYSYLGPPRQVEDATCEQALYIIRQTNTPELLDHRELQRQGLRTFAMDGISASYGGATSELCERAQVLLSAYVGFAAKIAGRGA